MQEWKYQVLHLVKPVSENRLKQMGRQGWELAGVVSDPAGPRLRFIYYFKRPRPQPTARPKPA